VEAWLPRAGQERSIFGGGVSFDSGAVYITTGLGEVAALDAADGKVKWQVKPAGPCAARRPWPLARSM
jgi:outer membrane protein assembly factor BamB